MKTRYRHKNGHLVAPKAYYLRGMRYWAKDSMEAHKLLHEAQQEIKILKQKIKEIVSEK